MKIIVKFLFVDSRWNGYYPTWSDETQVMVISLLGAGHLEMKGLRHAFVLACELDAAETTR
jgi:hypothetical protein